MPSVRSTRPHIAVLLHNLEAGGAERSMATLTTGFADAGAKVDLLLVQRRGPFLDEISNRVRIIDLQSRRCLYSIPKIIRYLQRERPAVLLSALVQVNIAAIIAAKLARTGTRIVITERGYTEWAAAQDPSRRARIAYRFAPWLYPLADEIIAVSAGVAESVTRFCRLPSEKVHAIANPIAIRRNPEPAAGQVVHPWLRAGMDPVVISVGRLSPEKDFCTLVRAFALLRRKRSAKMIIVGEGRCRTEIETLCRELGIQGDVSLPGLVLQPFDWMEKAAVFVLSSKSEGFPRALVEAMACGTPVVASDCPSGPSEILENGRYGELVPTEDPAALARAIDRTLDNPQARERLRSRAACFGVERAVEAYLAVLMGNPMSRADGASTKGRDM